jgi:PleD family two-component response regulator
MRPETPQVTSRGDGKTVLLLTDRRRSALKRYLTNAGYLVAETFTPDQAVAICVNSPVDVVVLDQAYFVETDGWSVAQSLKAVKAHVCVLLVIPVEKFNEEVPQGVDAMITGEDEAELLGCLERLLSKIAPQQAEAASAKGEIVHSKHPVSLEDWCEGVDSPE